MAEWKKLRRGYYCHLPCYFSWKARLCQSGSISLKRIHLGRLRQFVTFPFDATARGGSVYVTFERNAGKCRCFRPGLSETERQQLGPDKNFAMFARSACETPEGGQCWLERAMVTEVGKYPSRTTETWTAVTAARMRLAPQGWTAKNSQLQEIYPEVEVRKIADLNGRVTSHTFRLLLAMSQLIFPMNTHSFPMD